MIALNEEVQSFFVGIRSIFFRIAIISNKGLLVILADYLIDNGTDIDFAWAVTFATPGIAMIGFALYYTLAIPKPIADKPKEFYYKKRSVYCFFQGSHGFL